MLVITSVISVLGFLYPGVLEALRRDPEALASGEWWRILSPLLVHDGGWPHLVLNSAGLIVVGTAIERLIGSGRWLALYLAGGLTGETAGYAWQPDGAGNSVAIFGLAGGLVALFLAGRGVRVPPLATLFVVYWVAALTGEAAGGLWEGVLLCLLIGVPLGLLFARDAGAQWVSLYAGGVSLLGAITLAALRDIHGPALIAGACVAVPMLWHAGRRRGVQR